MRTYRFVNEPRIAVYGRTHMCDALALYWTASGFELCFDGSQLWLDVESRFDRYEEWIRVELDGASLIRMPLPQGRNGICLLRGLESGVRHTVRLMKEVQPKQSDPNRFLLLHGVECDGELHPLARKRCRIECVGDSLSAGEGLAGSVQTHADCSSVYGTEGHYMLRVGKAFDADVRILAQSGWGVYCAWNNDITHVMPACYDEICGVIAQSSDRRAMQPHDFSSWQPDVVIVNLGSNDEYAFDNGPWIDPLTGKAYQQTRLSDGSLDRDCAQKVSASVSDFLKKLRRRNPEAWLVWAYGMGFSQEMHPWLREGVLRYERDTGDRKALYVPLPSPKPDWIGSNNHPDRRAHATAAEELIRVLAPLLKCKE